MPKEESPNEFNAHCTWLGKKMQAWENKQKKWDKNSKKEMNYHFRKEINKNTRLVLRLSEKVFGKPKVLAEAGA